MQVFIVSTIIFNELKPTIDLATCGMSKGKCIYELKLALPSRSWLPQLARASIMVEALTRNYGCVLLFLFVEKSRNYQWNLQVVDDA